MSKQKLIIVAAVIACAGMMDACGDDSSKSSPKTPILDCLLPGMVSCDGTCIDPLTDNNWCGANADCTNYVNCAADGKTCVIGVCVGSGTPTNECEPGKVKCGEDCIDPLTDNAHCGADAACQNFTACVDGQACAGGTCNVKPEDGNCPNGLVKCGDICIDPQTNKSYCGADAACANYTDCAAQGKTCEAGACVGGAPVNECDPGQVKCGEDCIDPLTDNAHCGADAQCLNFTACIDDKTCVGGECSAKPVDGKCPEGQVKCGEVCIDPQTNKSFCGADDACANYTDCAAQGKTCEAGACVGGAPVNECDPGQVKCGEDCIDPRYNDKYCGADENCQNYIECKEHEWCMNGQCGAKPDQPDCEPGQSCQIYQDCEPGTSTCTEDDKGFAYLDSCADSGKVIVRNLCETDDPNARMVCSGDACTKQCNDDYEDVDGKCTHFICKENERRCDEDRIMVCNSERTGFDVDEQCKTDDPNATASCIEYTDKHGGEEVIEHACQTQCNEGYTTDKETGLCAQIVCISGTLGCNDENNKVVACNDTGTGYTVLDTCTSSDPHGYAVCDADSKSCTNKCNDGYTDVGNGVCTEIICIAGNKKCGDAAVLVCDVTGTQYGVEENCTTDDPNATAICSNNSCVKTCNDDYVDVGGVCTKTNCKSGDKKCSGDKVMVCNSTGTGYDEETTCSTTDLNATATCDVTTKTCVTSCNDTYTNVDGVCKKIICKSGDKKCDGNKVMACNSTGTGYDEEMACSTTDPNATSTCSGNACVTSCNDTYTEVDGVCKKIICSAGEEYCMSEINAAKCNATGTDNEYVMTCEYGCEDGKCSEPVICTPGNYRCSSDNKAREVCSSKGTAWNVAENCTTTDPNATAFCNMVTLLCDTSCKDGYSEVGGVCTLLICTSGEKKCDGNKVMVCNSTGTAWEEHETCDYSCESGLCTLPVICTSGDKKCDGNKVMLCNSTGTAWEEHETCAYSCESGLCTIPMICTPNEVTCADDNTTAICSEDGMSYESLLSCQTGQKCEDGVCKCQTAGLVNCGECIDPNTSNNYCGADATCSDYEVCLEHSSCQSGSCVCDTNYVQCGSECIDPKTSNAYCGADNTCGNYTTCNPDQTCVNGQCKCESNYIECGSECIDPKTSNTYCGADNACANYTTCNSDQTCQNGACVCNETGKVMCNGVCIDPMTSNRYCGADDACENYSRCGGFVGIHDNLKRQICIDGECKCPEDTPHYCEVGSGLGFCVDLQTDPAHCGHPFCKNSCYSVQNMMAGGLSLEMIQQCRESLENCPVEIACEAGKCVYNNGCMIFVDSAIEAYALAHWDTDNDGCIKGNEARAVTEIPANAFKGNTSVQTLTDLNKFPNLTTIGSYAFEGTTKLKTVSLTRVTTVGEGAFKSSGVKSLKLNNVETIPKYMCYDCYALETLNLPSATTLGTSAFEESCYLTDVSLPKVQIVGEYALAGWWKAGNACINSYDLVLPAATQIKNNAFTGSGIRSIELNAEDNIYIGEQAFQYALKLTTVKAKNVHTVGKHAFLFLTDLTTAYIDNVVKLEQGAFDQCEHLTTLSSTDILPKLQYIYGRALSKTNIHSLSLPNVTQINSGAFSEANIGYLYIHTNYNNPLSELGATKIEHLKANMPGCGDTEIGYYEHTGSVIGAEAFMRCNIKQFESYAVSMGTRAFQESKLERVNLYNLKSVPDLAFYMNAYLFHVELPKAESIGAAAFMYGVELRIISLPEVKLIYNDAFSYTRNLLAFYMPKIAGFGTDAFKESGIKTINWIECLGMQASACSSSKYCVNPYISFGNGYVMSWTCKSGETCSTSVYGAKICE